MQSYLPLALCLVVMTTVCCSDASVKLLENFLERLQSARFRQCSARKWIKYKIDVDMTLKVCKRPNFSPPRLSRRQSFQIKKLFPGMFLSCLQYTKLTRRTESWNMNDGDMCCPTVKSDPVKEDTLVNVLGETKTLVHLDSVDMYQWITYGSCAEPKCISTDGTCVIEKTTRFLLVWDFSNPTLPFSYDAFEIPTYCSCKNF
ncbi:uncharacterized protein LOC135468737 [Liolophura sinensis]|uniref:uncharacterized protein LOC135468737 n=1 Tax=Liolophura sinensis TaxID=3198878 RepID=UPI0031581FEC